MPNATLIVPIGNFTPQLVRRINAAALANAQQHDVVISMRSTRHYSWSALCDFARSLRGGETPHRIQLAHAVPRTRALLQELGIGGGWFLPDADIRSRARILICETPDVRGREAAAFRYARRSPRSLGRRRCTS